MAESPAEQESFATSVCRGCGKPLPKDTELCQECVRQFAHSILMREDRDHTFDIILAVIAFGLTNLTLMGIAGMDVFTLESMAFRLILLGIPCAVVIWRWYRLMHQVDPDYGQLWYTYWSCQAVVWIWFLIVWVVLSVILFFVLMLVGWRR